MLNIYIIKTFHHNIDKSWNMTNFGSVYKFSHLVFKIFTTKFQVDTGLIQNLNIVCYLYKL